MLDLYRVYIGINRRFVRIKVLIMTTENQVRSMKPNRKAYLLHMNEDLYFRLHIMAARESRTVNSLINSFLQRYTANTELPEGYGRKV